MSLRIRLRRMGRKKAPHYRIVVAESTMPRDGRFVATVGHYNPTTNPATLKVDSAKAAAWLAKGAVPTDTVRSLFRKAGVTGDIIVEYQGNVAEMGTSAASTSVKRITLGDADKEEAPRSVAVTEELLAHLDSLDDSPDEIVRLLGLTVEDIDRVTEYFSRYLDPEDREALISLRIAAESHARVHDPSPEVLPDSVVSSPASSGA